MYDFLIVTHLPSFYKVRLYNELAIKSKIFVIYLGKLSNERSLDFTEEVPSYEYVFLSDGAFEDRHLFFSCVNLFSLLRKINFQKVIISGWEQPEFWLLAFFVKKSKNTLALESNIFHSTKSGLKLYIKKIFLLRIGAILASGEHSRQLAHQLGFKGKISITHGVGIIKKAEIAPHLKSYTGLFIYIGRLSPEKNLIYLFKVFQSLPNLTLRVIGSGPQKEELLSLKPENVEMLGEVPNSDLSNFFSKSDFLILPSKREAWGLVVEESLYCFNPVIVSKYCGSKSLVLEGVNGFIFDPDREGELEHILENLTNTTYERLKKNTGPFAINDKDKIQLQSYLELL